MAVHPDRLVPKLSLDSTVGSAPRASSSTTVRPSTARDRFINRFGDLNLDAASTRPPSPRLPSYITVMGSEVRINAKAFSSTDSELIRRAFIGKEIHSVVINQADHMPFTLLPYFFHSMKTLHVEDMTQAFDERALSKMDRLESISFSNCTGIVPDLNLAPRLQTVSIENCSLRKLPCLGRSVFNLSVSSCPKLIEFNISHSNIVNLKVSNLELAQHLYLAFTDHLQSLTINGCHSLEGITGPGVKSSLKILKISNCDGIRALRTKHFGSNLRTAVIRNCLRLTAIDTFQQFKNLFTLTLVNLPCLVRPPKRLYQCSEMRSIQISTCSSITMTPRPGWFPRLTAYTVD